MTSAFVAPKYFLGSKNLTIYDPIWMKSQFESKAFVPIITPHNVNKEGVLMYLLQVKDTNTEKIVDVMFQIPEIMASTIHLGTPEEDTSSLQAVWETSDKTSDDFKSAINQLLEFWLCQIQQANSFSTEPRIYFLNTLTKLKWPWKNCTNADYFLNFHPDTDTHMIKLGVGYYNSIDNCVGVTLQLSNYPGKTRSSIVAKRARKRKIVESSEVAASKEEETSNEETV